MYAAWCLVAVSTLGVDYGWQPLDSGGFEYIIQIEPQVLEALRQGEEITSDLPPQMRDVRSFRIRVGTKAVPQLGNPQAAAVENSPPPARQTDSAEPADRAEVKPEPALNNRQPDLRYSPGGLPESRPDEAGNSSPASEKPSLPGQFQPLNRWSGEPRYADRSSGAGIDSTDSPDRAVDSTDRGPVPRPFEPDPESSALVNQTSGYRDEPDANASPAPIDPVHTDKSLSQTSSQTTEPARPWLPLTLALLGLFVSLGGNAYLGWQWLAMRSRCQQLLRQQRQQAAGGRPGRLQTAADDDAGGEKDADNADEEYDEEADDEDQDVLAIDDQDAQPADQASFRRRRRR